MNAKLLARFKTVLANRRKRQRLFMATGGVSLLVVGIVFVSLMVPAISMEQKTPLLEADPATVELGAKVGVKVTATARTKDDTVYLLSEIGEGGSFASGYAFDDKGELQVKTEDGKDLVIHRVDRSKNAADQVADAEQEIKSATGGAAKVSASDATSQEADESAESQSVFQAKDVDVPTLEAQKDFADEKQDPSAQSKGETKSLYWFVVPRGATVTFAIDHESVDGSQHKLTLRGASGTSYSEAIKALQDAKAKEDASGAKPDKEGNILNLEWRVPDTTSDQKQKGESAPDKASDTNRVVSDEGKPANESDSKDDAVTPIPSGWSEQTVKAALYADDKEETPSEEQSVVISIQGAMPQGVTASAHPVHADIDGQTVLTAYDITMRNADGSVFQPAEGHPVKVTISSSALQTGSGTIGVYHAGGSDNERADADTQTATDDAAKVDAMSGTDGASSSDATKQDDSGSKESSNAEASDTQQQSTYEYVGAAERVDVASVSFYASHFSPYALAAAPLRAPGNPGTLKTEDTRAVGITLNLFDYEAYDNQFATNGNSHLSDGQYNTGINSNNGQFRDLRFYPSGIEPNAGSSWPFSTSAEPYTINNYTGSTATALQGVVKSTLDSNGYPHTTGFNNQSSNLSYLFDPKEPAGGKTSYADVNHLFTLDASGYYRYDSGWGKRDSSGNMRNGNYAYYNPGQGNKGDFIVYDRTFTNSNYNDQGSDASNDSVGFFPFDPYDTNNSNVKLDNHQPHHNHHLGLSMSASFMIPEGKTVNGNDMVFNFSGDDDMWVFIDDVLVLDIGGVHQPVSGSINFTQGTSTIGQAVQAVSGQSTIGKSKSIADIFAAAGKTWDGSEYSQHTIKCFYLERGGCYSDLSLSFNLPIYNPGQIHVTKTVDGPGSAGYKDTGFKFRVFIEKSEGSGQYAQYTGPVTMDDGSQVAAADSDGLYTLKDGQGFKVSTQNDKLRYYIEEIDPGSAFSTTINGQATGRSDDGGTQVIKSETRPAGDPETHYKNSVTGTTVSVQKRWYEQDGTTEKTADLPESISLTLHRTWDTTEGGGTVTPSAKKHTVTFRLTSHAVSNAFVSQVTDVADGGSLTFYPYGGVKADESADPWSLPSVRVENGSATLAGNGSKTIAWVERVPGYKLTNITSDVTVLLTHDDWITTNHTRTDYSVPNVTEYTKAQEGGGAVTPPTPGVVTHHDEVIPGPEGTKVVTAADGWRAEWNGLPMTDEQGNPYTYYVDESTVPAGYEVVYENNGTTNGSGSHTGIPSGEITVKNKLAYQLPHTGGPGKEPLVVVGLAITVAAVMLYFSRYRRAHGSER